MQQAYLVGRQPGFALGGVGSHFFVEFEIADLDLTRLETVWNRLIARHDMLRAVVRDGQQQVLEQTPRWVIPAHILHTPEEALQVREKLAHQVLNPKSGRYSISRSVTLTGCPPACGCVWITCYLTG